MIVKTITDDYYFWNWLKNSSYKDNFSLEGAKAVQAYMDEYSEETESGSIEFDPIAWCVEFSEYDSLDEAYYELVGAGLDGSAADISTDEKLEYFQDRTTVIELDNGHIIVGEF